MSALVDRNAEEQVLGYAIRNPRLAARKLLAVRAEWFYHESNRSLWRVIEANIGSPDLPTVLGVVTRDGLAQLVGDASHIQSLVERAPSWPVVEQSVARVRDLAKTRAMVAVGKRLVALESSPPADVEKEQGAAIEAIMASSGEEADEWLTLADHHDRLEERQREAKDDREKGQDHHLRTGILIFDERRYNAKVPRLSWSFGKQVVIAGRPGSGKSSLMRQAVRGLCVHQSTIKACVLTWEMSDNDQADEFIASAAGVQSAELLDYHPERQHDGIVSSKARRENKQIVIRSPRRYTYESLRLDVEFAVRVLGCRVIALDYIGLADTGNSRRTEALEQISKYLKRVAKDHGAITIVLSQLNRDVEKRGGEPMLSDLRESGALEQDADVVVFTHTPKDETGEPSTDRRVVICAKQRRGSTWREECAFHGPTTTFRALSSRGEEC